jgi:uncharacterized protein (TIGR03435 family)
MIRTLSAASLVCVLSAALVAQSADSKPAFESADVHTVSVSRLGTTMSGGALRGGRYDVRGATMIDLIHLAYGVDNDRILGGPGWLETDYFDVLAKAPAGATADSAKQMLQALLVDRFGLAVRHDSRPVPVFALTPGKGAHKMKAASDAGSGCQGVPPPPGPPAPGTIPRGAITCKGVTMNGFAEFIRQAAGGYLTKEVVNETKIDGTFDFELSWTPRGALAQAGGDGISVFDAVDRQLGLKIEEKKVSMPVIVVEKANQKPTANAPGVGEPEGPVEFEVAEIKPSPPDSQGLRLQYLPGGRINAEGALGDLVGGALGIPPNLRGDLLVGMPKGPGSTRYTIVAKAPSTGAGAAVRGDGGRDQPPPLGVALEMLKNLFIERFKLKTHVENQPAAVYALIVDKGGVKMKKSDGTDRASCKQDRNAAPGGGVDNAPVIAWKCQNTSIAELADNLPNWAGGYMDHPVVDGSGVADRFDFALWWTPKAQLHPMRPEATGGGAAVDPGGMSIFESVERQLGLKLDQQKRSIPVTVVDHLEDKPTEG